MAKGVASTVITRRCQPDVSTLEIAAAMQMGPALCQPPSAIPRIRFVSCWSPGSDWAETARSRSTCR